MMRARKNADKAFGNLWTDNVANTHARRFGHRDLSLPEIQFKGPSRLISRSLGQFELSTQEFKG